MYNNRDLCQNKPLASFQFSHLFPVFPEYSLASIFDIHFAKDALIERENQNIARAGAPGVHSLNEKEPNKAKGELID